MLHVHHRTRPAPARSRLAAGVVLAVSCLLLLPIPDAVSARQAQDKPADPPAATQAPPQTPPTDAPAGFGEEAETALPVPVRIQATPSPDSVRVIFTFERPVAYAVAETETSLQVVFSEAIEAQPETRDFEDLPVLQGWAQVDPRTVLFRLGGDYARFEQFELRNPQRLVLDLYRADSGALEGTETFTLPRTTGVVVVVDPGHGGVEDGATGPGGLKEKDVALDLARRVRALLQQDPNLNVILTRDGDQHLELDERTAIANHNRAQLFVSIHLNASPRREAFGAETYYLSADATDDEARTLAALENKAYAVDAGSGDAEDPDLQLILWDLAQNRYLAESSLLAEAIQRKLNVVAGTRDRGVRQAPFRVLMGATMPAVLVEAGFISNPDEARRFRSEAYRQQVAEAIASAVMDFLKGLRRVAAPPAGGTGAGKPRP